MKKPNIILLFLMVLTCWMGCHKDNDPDAQEPEVTDVKVTPQETGASFIWSVVMPGKFQTGVEVSEHENMSAPLSLEAYENDGRFVASIDSLTPNTTYYYRIVVWNKFKRFEFEKDGTSFTTLETPPTPGQDTVYYDITVSVNLLEGGTATGGGRYAKGDTCTVVATANEGYVFMNWSENNVPVDTNSVYSFVVTGDRDLVANFRHDEYEIKVEWEPENGGTATGGGMFHYGDTITLSATPYANFSFAGWSDGSTDNPREVVVTGPATYKAIFSEAGAVYYHVTTHAQPIEGGEVTGQGTYLEGTQVELKAIPNEGYYFEKWDDGNTDNPRTITVNADMEFTAFFKKIFYTVTVQAGTGGAAHIGDMSGTIEATFEHGESCTVHALPETGYSFVNWMENGTEASTDDNYSFIVTSNHNLVANFQQQQYWIGTSVDPTNSGTVSGGNRYYNHGEQCNLTATANEQYEFDHWTKNGSSYPGGTSISFTVTEAASYTAHFHLKQYTISVSASTGGSAHVGSPTGPTTVTYTSGQQCTVYAVANTNYTFTNWTEVESGNVASTEANYTFTVTGNRNLRANFNYTPPQTYTITVSANPSNGGTAHVGSPTGPTTGTYTSGQQCTVYAVANSNYTFTNWTEGGQVVQGAGATYTFPVTANRTLVANFTYNPPTYTITVSANPSNGGTAHVGSPTGPTTGTFTQGQSCTIYATANEHYTFTNWKKGNSVVSTNATYTFDVTESATYTAYFTQDPQYTITATANPTNGGQVTGGGTYYAGTTVNLTANAYSGFIFDHWQDGNTNNPRTITVTGNATYTAYFEAQPQAPTGAIPGKFTIDGSGNKVYFSQGNLQYRASTNTWRFAENQWDFVGTQNPPSGQPTGGTVSGSDNFYISQTYNGWIDLFGWGTSGYNHGAVCYQPWSTSQTNSDYYAYGNWQYNLYDQTGQADWGYNAISNGGNTTNTWRTLTGGSGGEWDYVFNTRSTTSGIRYAKAQVNGVNGVILLPDDWSASYYSLSNTNQGGASYTGNVISASQWNTLEEHGAVFLPAAGNRNGTSVYNVGSYGYYWSASYNDSSCAHGVGFSDSGLDPQNYDNRYNGHSVRLVRSAQ